MLTYWCLIDAHENQGGFAGALARAHMHGYVNDLQGLSRSISLRMRHGQLNYVKALMRCIYSEQDHLVAENFADGLLTFDDYKALSGKGKTQKQMLLGVIFSRLGSSPTGDG